MKKSKWNWDKIKIEYLESDYQEVRAFFLRFHGTFNSTIKHKTVGWSKSKKIHVKRAQFKAIERNVHLFGGGLCKTALLDL